MARNISASFQKSERVSIAELECLLDRTSGLVDITVEDDLPIHLRWFDRGFDRTLVTFSAAITKRIASEVPVFSGWSMAKSIDANLLMVSDPSLLLDSRLNLSWYLGSASQPYLVGTLAEILTTFSRRGRLTFFGGSGGGFASMLYASKVPGARAVVSNPQVDVRHYSYYGSYIDLAWNGRPALARHLLVDVGFIYSDEIPVEIVYIQNAQDLHHMEFHFRSFVRRLHPANRVLPLLPELGSGHIGPSANDLSTVLQTAIVVEEWNALSEELRHLSFQVRS